MMQPHISVRVVWRGLSTISSTRPASFVLTMPNFSGRVVGNTTSITSSSASADAHARPNTSCGSMIVSAIPKNTVFFRTR